MPEDAVKVFREIAQHRNKMIHFVHEATTTRLELRDSKELEIVVSEQLLGWHHLYKLLTGKWKPYFSDFDAKIHYITLRIRGHKGFLQNRFDSLKDDISQMEAQGDDIRSCPNCGYKSAKVELIDLALHSQLCIVCSYIGEIVKLECATEDCFESIEFDSFNGPPDSCPSCKSPFADTVAEQLDTGDPVTSDNYFDVVDINCPHCSGYHTVVEHNKGYVCTECYQYSKIMGVCGYCSDGQLDGVSEFSYHLGCEFCEGRDLD